jgi:hypothetical protein
MDMASMQGGRQSKQPSDATAQPAADDKKEEPKKKVDPVNLLRGILGR